MIILAAVSTSSAYVIGVCVSVILVLLAALIAKVIKFNPDLSDVKKRKIWFWIFAVLCPVFTFVIAYLAIYSGIRARNQQNAYMVAMGIASGVSIVLYVIMGIIASKIDRNGKIGNWF